MESKYNYFQVGLIVLGLPIFICVWFYGFTGGSLFQNLFKQQNYFIIFALLSFVITFVNLIVQIRKLKLSSTKIESKFPFPVFDNSIRISDLDYFIVVDANRRKNYENIWLVKDKQVKMVISSQFYKNFDELKRYLSNHLENKKTIKANLIDHFLAKFNYTISKLP